MPQLVPKGRRADVLDGIGHLASSTSDVCFPCGVMDELRQINESIGCQQSENCQRHCHSHHGMAYYRPYPPQRWELESTTRLHEYPEAIDKKEGQEQRKDADLDSECQPHHQPQQGRVPQPTMVHYLKHEIVGGQHQQAKERLRAVEVTALYMYHCQGHQGSRQHPDPCAIHSPPHIEDHQHSAHVSQRRQRPAHVAHV